MADTVDLYNRRTMVKALNQMFPIYTFLLDTFFPVLVDSFVETETIDIDIYDKSTSESVYTTRNGEAVLVETPGFKTRSYKAGYISQKIPQDLNKILQERQAGVDMYSGGNNMATARAKLGKDLSQMKDMVWRRLEADAATLLRTGKYTKTGVGVSEELDFGRDASLSATAATLWSAAGADPIAYVEGRIDDSFILSGKADHICLLGETAATEFMDNTKVQAYLDNRATTVNANMFTKYDAIVEYIGTIKGVKYLRYKGVNGAGTRLIADDEMFLGSPTARTQRFFAPVAVPNASGKGTSLVGGAEVIADLFSKSDPAIDYLRTQTAPLLALSQANAFVKDVVV